MGIAATTKSAGRRRRDRALGAADDHIPVTELLRLEIERRAYQRYAARGYRHGHDLDDWLIAERELLMPRSFESGDLAAAS